MTNTTRPGRPVGACVIVIDPKLVYFHRIRAQLSSRELAAALRLSDRAISNLEAGSTQSAHTLGFVAELATALGVEPIELIAPTPDLPAAAEGTNHDVRYLGALLADLQEWRTLDEITEILGWTLERLHLALEGLELALRAAGQSIAWQSTYAIRVLPKAPPAKVMINAHRQGIQNGRLTVKEAYAIYDIIKHGKVVSSHTSSKDLKRLRTIGFINENEHPPIALTEETRWNLFL